MTDTGKAWLQIHCCVVLWGFTAIIGKLITIPAVPLVLWRMLLVAAILLCIPRVWRGLRKLSRRYLAAFCGVGILVALHWLSFYGAIKLANASVAATCIATVPVVLCLMEPLVTGRKFVFRELILGLLVLPGIVLVVGGTPDEMNLGIVVGIFSAVFAAIFSAYNKRLVYRKDALTATTLEMLSGGVFVLAVVGLQSSFPAQFTANTAFFPTSSTAFDLPSFADLM
jgi:drug/metabolite transporter (DMT)-like permease